MPASIQQFRVFIASPGGLEKERRKFREILNAYSESDAIPRGVMFTPVGWEETLGGTGRPQSLINKEIIECDFFILLLHDRWGSSPDPEAEGKYSSGTEEEYYVAHECRSDGERHMRDVVALFKGVDERQLSDPGAQLQKVIEFKTKLQDEKSLLYETFDSVEEFADLVRRHLAKWLLDKENGGAPTQDSPSGGSPTLNLSSPPEENETEGEPHGLVDEAIRLAEEGNLTEAETKFSQAVVGTNDLNALNRYGRFLRRVGRLDHAKVMYKRVIELGTIQEEEPWVAAGYGNLGIIYETRGELDKAEQMHRKSLEIEERLGRQEGMASDYGNLGNVYFASGELDKAEEMYMRAHEIEENLGTGSDYGNLGNVYLTRGELDKAEEMYRKSLDINEKLGQQEGIASQYGNLGIIYKTRGELDEAEEMFRKSLEIDERLGRQEGMATTFGNLGNVYLTHGKMDKAEEMYRKSLEISDRLGQQQGIATQYANLGNVYFTRGELDEAEEMYRKSLEIDERLGRQEGMANQYGNLGIVCRTRGDLDKAEEMYKKSLEINKRLGRQEGIAIQYANLGNVDKIRGDLDKAGEHWSIARAIFKKIGLPHMVEQISGLMDKANCNNENG